VLVAALALLAGAAALARGSRAAALGCIMAAGLAVSLYAASERAIHEWDERFHAVVARHLLDHPLTPTLYDDPVLPYDYRDWTANHVWLHKPPVTLWLMAGSLRVFGVSELAVRLPSVALTTAALWLTFAIGRRLFDDRVALTAAAFQAVNGLLVALASGRAPTDHVDAALVVFVELAVLVAIVEADRESAARRAALGAVIGVAVLTKWYPALLPLPLWLYLARNRPASRLAGGLALVAGAAALVVAPWAWHIARSFPAEAVWEWRYGMAHATEAVEAREAGPFFYIAAMPKFFGELVYIPIVGAVVVAFRRPMLAPLRVLLLWIAIPYAVFSAAATKMPAYIMIAAPAVFLVEAWFWWELACAPALLRRRGLRIALLIAFGVLPIRYLMRPGGPFTIVDRHPRWVVELEALRGQVREPRPVLFNMPRPIEAMFYLPWPAYAKMPSEAEARALTARGYSVFVYDAGALRRR
jgi:4-amino-4-deoxy-L-arabinose transferase-like glycosyltransferase